MNKKIYQIILIVLIAFQLHAQQATKQKTYFVVGKVTTKGTNEPIVRAKISCEEVKKDTLTSNLGFYLLKIQEGSRFIIFSAPGYYEKTIKIQIDGNKTLNVELELQASEFEKVTQLQEVEVNGQAPEQNLINAQMGVNTLSMKMARKLPTLFGEVDVIRNILLLPGVSTVGEGATGFNVRGGNIDQNLIMMEDAPIFNSSHLLGLFSVFNPDAVKDVALYKGGIPASFGGRVASVLDVKIKDPAKDRIRVNGGIGLLASRLTVEGPILKDRLSFLIAARGSSTDYIFKLVPNESIKKTKANFYDITSKIDYRIGIKDRLVFNFYRGKDIFKLPADTLSGLEINAGSSRFEWISQNASLRWSHVFSPSISINLTGVTSNYESNIIGTEPTNGFNLESNLLYENIKLDLGYYKNKHKMDFGSGIVRYNINPGGITPTSTISNINTLILPKEKSIEISAYFNNEWELSKRITIIYGLRYASFLNKGPGSVYQYTNGLPKDSTTISGKKTYADGKTIQSYGGFEPRLSMKISIDDKSSVKFSYNRMRQYLQLISNTTAALPSARWKVSDQYLKPQTADQVSFGYFRNFFDNNLEASVEMYYKKIENATDYKDGSNLLLERYPEAYLLQGKGRAYGVEVQLKRNIGQLTGWLSYTYSQSEQLINGSFTEEQINNGQYYPTNFNKPHQVNLVALYQHTPRISYAANFTYSSGRPITYPQAKYYVNGIYVPNFSNRNQDKIPDYNRLDVSMNIDPKPEKKSRFQSSWAFTIYNLYARQNAYSIFFKSKNSSYAQFYNKSESYKLSVFGTIFPAITYNFKF